MLTRLRGVGPEQEGSNRALEHLVQKLHPPSVKVEVGNTCKPGSKIGDCQYYEWTVFLREDAKEESKLVASVTFDLHPTFTPPSVTLTKPPFQITRQGWGTFPVRVTILLQNGESFTVEHQLQFVSPSNTASFEFLLQKKPATEAPRMTDVDHSTAHGHLAPDHWAPPLLVTRCDLDARPGYQTCKAHEYQDDPITLREKVKLLVSLLERAKCPVLYTGAGISTASGIGDYATKSKSSVTKGSGRSQGSGLNAEPTLAHRVLTALHGAGKVANWVQQNHDGLPQKAGFPQNDLNEIHGAWFDPSNPVVPMSGSLRNDLCKTLYKYEHKTDLCIAMGTSLCGMNADRMVTTPSQKFLGRKRGNDRSRRSKIPLKSDNDCLGSVIIGLQQTQYDSICSLRIFGKIDEVMALLAWEMNLPVLSETQPYECSKDLEPAPDLFLVPYNETGNLVTNGPLCFWDLRPGAKITVNGGPGHGFIGQVRSKTRDGHYEIALPCIREGSPDHGKGKVLYLLGVWWVQQAVEGLAPALPVVNRESETAEVDMS